MSTQIQRRRGTTAEHTVFTGALAELTVDTTKKTLVVHDGTTAGGIPLARQDLSNVPSVGYTLITPGAARTVFQTNAGGTAAEWTNTLDLGGTLDVTGAVTFDSTLSVAGVINVGSGSTIIFEGSTANDFETTLSVVDPTADRTILLPNVSGTVITTGDTGTVTSTLIANDTIVNTDINSAAAIAGTKISPNFGSQNITTTGATSSANFVPTAATVPVNGLYLPDTNVVGIATNSVQRVNLGTTEVVFNDAGNDYDFRVESDTSTHMIFVDAGNNRVGINNSAPGTALDVTGVVTAQSFIPSSATVPANGVYLPAANSVGISTNGVGRLRIVSGGQVLLQSSNSFIGTDTEDGSDTSTLLIGGGGAASSSRGAYVWMKGNENVDPGSLFLSAGNVGTAFIAAITSGAERLRITSTGTVNIVGAGSAGTTQAVSFNGSAPVNSMVLDSSGRLLVGTSSSRSVGNAERLFQIESVDADASLSLTRNSNDASTPSLIFGKTRGSALNDNTIVQNGDFLGRIVFAGADGVDVNSSAARIDCQVDGTPGTNDMPGRLVFSTTADGASSPTERMRITSAGLVGIGTTSPDYLLDCQKTGSQLIRSRTNDTGAGSSAGGFIGEYLGGGGGTNTQVSLAASNNYAFLSTLTNAPLFLGVNSAEQLRITTDRYVRLFSGTGGIQFNGDTAAANALDDYEEGTWTPAITFSTPGDLAVTYTSQIGAYTKIGDTVTVFFRMVTSSFTHTTASSTLRITGLPYAASSSNPNYQGSCFSSFQGITNASFDHYAVTVNNGQSYLAGTKSGSGQTTTNIIATDLPSGGAVILIGTVTYKG